MDGLVPQGGPELERCEGGGEPFDEGGAHSQQGTLGGRVLRSGGDLQVEEPENLPSHRDGATDGFRAGGSREVGAAGPPPLGRMQVRFAFA